MVQVQLRLPDRPQSRPGGWNALPIAVLAQVGTGGGGVRRIQAASIGLEGFGMPSTGARGDIVIEIR